MQIYWIGHRYGVGSIAFTDSRARIECVISTSTQILLKKFLIERNCEVRDRN